VRLSWPPRPEITVPTTAHRRRPGIVIHRVQALHPRDVCVVDGIPTTTVPRVLLDLAPSLQPAKLTRACHEAWVHHRVRPEHIEACIARNSRPTVLSYGHMRLAFILIAVLLTCASTATAAAPAPKAPKLGATLETCATSPLPAQRIASFVGSMPARADRARMQMRFELERKRDGQRSWRRLKARGFGVWERADPNVAGFVFTKRVTGLPVPATYRALVRFRWLAADGSTVKRARAHTRACRQPDLRPNLVPGALSAALDVELPGMAVYTLIVRNTGRSAAAPFSVSVGSGSAEVGELAAGQERAVAVVAPVCLPSLPIVVRVDADRRVEESQERGNGARRPCPLPLG
jgi:hypothetical protein